MTDNDRDDVADAELERLRRRLELKAIAKADEMLDDPRTPATAKASVIRGIFSDSAARRHDSLGDDKEPHQKTLPELRAALARRERQLAPLLIEDAEILEPVPAGASVFD